MKPQWLIIPTFEKLQESVELAAKYDAGFEYNDFWSPKVYEDAEEVKHRIDIYKSLERDRSRDTLHGVFLDISIASTDKKVREYSRMRVEQSMAIAENLGVKGVVFHTGLIAGLNLDYYIKDWLCAEEELIRMLAEKYPGVELYMENTFENSPEALIALAEKLQDIEQFGLCLDYGHAALSKTPTKVWVEELSPYIRHCHLNDNDLVRDLHLVPGQGKIDFSWCFALMEQYQVKAPVLLEINGIENQKKALRYFMGDSIR